MKLEVSDEVREKFEQEVFREYFFRRIDSDMTMKPGPTLFKAELCARDEDGGYVRDEVNAMFFGYCMALEHGK